MSYSLTSERLREILSYDPSSGTFIWRSKPSPRANRVKIGNIAGSMCVNGYRSIGINGEVFLEHRLAWLYMTGKWPISEIDHMNGRRDDNRINNLREATHAENAQNLCVYRKNTSGIVGVAWHKKARKWESYIQANGIKRHLGLFMSKEAAFAAYLSAKTTLHKFQPSDRI